MDSSLRDNVCVQSVAEVDRVDIITARNVGQHKSCQTLLNAQACMCFTRLNPFSPFNENKTSECVPS